MRGCGVVGLVVVLALAGCPPDQTHSALSAWVNPGPLPVFTPPAGFTTLRMGLVPFLARETMSANHQRLAQYLSRQLSVPVEVLVGDSYDDSIDRLVRGEFDLMELSPYAYVLASRRMKLHCVAMNIADGSATSAGYIFVREDSPRRTLEGLKGARFGFVDKHSTSGYLFPSKLLKDRGIDPRKDLASTEFFGNHEAVLLAVLEGRVDAGSTYQGSFLALRRSRGVDPLSFRIIGKTPRNPRDIYCLRPGVPKEVADAVGRSLMALSARDRAGREILGPLNVNGFHPPDDSLFDLVRKTADEVEADDAAAASAAPAADAAGAAVP